MRPYPTAIGLASVLAAACQREEPPPLPEERGKVPASAPFSSLPLTSPTASEAAFMPKTDVCREPYEELYATCVHRYYRARVSPSEIEYQVTLYRGGASSPPVDATTTRGAPANMPWALAPSDLTVNETPKESATQLAQTRIKALDDMLTSVRESVVSARLQRLRTPSAVPAPPSDTLSAARSSAAAPRLADNDNVAGPPDETLGTGPEANVAGPPEREIGLEDQRGRESASNALRERMAQVRQIQTLLNEMPMEQRDAILRKLESSGARTAVGDETWSELVRR